MRAKLFTFLILVVLTTSVSAKTIKLRTNQIVSFENLYNKKFLIVMKNNKVYELYNLGQFKAVTALCLERSEFFVKVK
jgi:hypothetical protein